MRFRGRRAPIFLIVAGLIGLGFLGVSSDFLIAQDDVEELEDLKEEQDRIEREAARAMLDIDVVNATVEEVSEALDQLAAVVDTHQARVESAEQAQAQAETAIRTAVERLDEIATEQTLLEERVAELAVAGFTGESGGAKDDVTKLVLSDDPGESARFLHLLELQTGSIADSIDGIRALEIEANEVVEARRSAEAEAADALAEVEARDAELQEALDIQEQVVNAAQIRLEAQLAEAAILQERDVELAAAIVDQQSSINRRIADRARRNGVEIPTPVRLEDITELKWYADGVVPEPEIDPETGLELPVIIPPDADPLFAIEVHSDIAAQTQSLFDDAFAAGVDLAGWGYRPIQLQIELRAAHCGGTEYDIWHRPVFECAPPTARPGFSRHEQGRAIDFTYNGSSITSHANVGFRWLAANAPRYGFVNLPSEPWHWSIAPNGTPG